MTIPQLHRSEGPSMTRAAGEQQIARALRSLGIGFSDAAKLVVYDPNDDTASWRFNPTTGEERIHIGPTIARLEPELIALVIRHEVLHAACYHDLGQRRTDPHVSNLALDICINRLLYSVDPDGMLRLSREVYPVESKDTAIALADPSASPEKLSPELSALWKGIWKGEASEPPALEPGSLYYRLVRVRAQETLPDWFRELVTQARALGWPSAATRRVIDQVLAEIARGLPSGGSALAEGLNEYSFSPVALGVDRVAEFVTRIVAPKVLDPSVRRLTDSAEGGVRFQPYPLLPTFTGLVYRAVGLSQRTGLHLNQESRPRGARLAIAIYADLSPSMERSLGIVAQVVDLLHHVPIRLRAFDTEVRDVDIAALVGGRASGGLGTDFDAPLHDLIQDPECVAGVVITDGHGPLSTGVARALGRTGKDLYVILVRPPGERVPLSDSPLLAIATEVLEIAPDPVRYVRARQGKRVTRWEAADRHLITGAGGRE